MGRWGGGTLFRAKETSFFCTKKEENEIFIIFQFERFLLTLLVIKNKSITNSILDNDGVVWDILDMILIIFHKRASKKI